MVIAQAAVAEAGLAREVLEGALGEAAEGGATGADHVGILDCLISYVNLSATEQNNGLTRRPE